MRYSFVAPLALAAGAHAWGSNVTYVTDVVTSYTTYCPGPTKVAHNGVTYTVTEATVLTITNCPCTITKPVPVAPQTSVAVAPPVVSSEVAPPVVSSVAVAPPVAESSVVAAPAPSVEVSVAPSAAPAPPFPTSSPEAPAAPAAPAPSASAPSAAPVSPATPAASPFTGAGNKVAASGMGLAALAGLAAFFL